MTHLAGVAANPRPAGQVPHAQVETSMHGVLTEKIVHIERNIVPRDVQGPARGEGMGLQSQPPKIPQPKSFNTCRAKTQIVLPSTTQCVGRCALYLPSPWPPIPSRGAAKNLKQVRPPCHGHLGGTPPLLLLSIPQNQGNTKVLPVLPTMAPHHTFESIF